jgi:micrococcal nuclease
MDGYLVKVFEDSDKEEFEIKRVIDGDTIVTEGDLHIRLFGINTPEKGEKYYQEAKEFLEDLVLNKKVSVKLFGKDKYSRELGILFLDGKNINSELIKNGFANVYILEEKDYEEEFRKAWKECISLGKNLCELSKEICGKCIELKNIDFKKQEIVFYNNCNFDCELTNWTIKDEGRKKFAFPKFILKSKQIMNIIVDKCFDTERRLCWKGEEYVWTETGDTLFLREDSGKLILYKEI